MGCDEEQIFYCMISDSLERAVLLSWDSEAGRAWHSESEWEKGIVKILHIMLQC